MKKELRIKIQLKIYLTLFVSLIFAFFILISPEIISCRDDIWWVVY